MRFRPNLNNFGNSDDAESKELSTVHLLIVRYHFHHATISVLVKVYEPRREETCLGLGPGPTRTGLYSARKWLKTSDLESRRIVLSMW